MKQIILAIGLLATCMGVAHAQQYTAFTNAPAMSAVTYNIGECFGGVFTNFVANGGGRLSPILDSLTLFDLSKQSPGLTVLIFPKDPATDGWILVDHNVVGIPTNPRTAPVVVSVLPTDWVTVGTVSSVTFSSLRLPLNFISDPAQAYVAFVLTSAPVYTKTKQMLVTSNWIF